MKFEVYSIILGGTDSLLNVKLPDGYEFIRLRTNGTCINERIRGLDGKLLVQYYTSNIGDSVDDPEFICIYKYSKIENNIQQHKEKAFKEIEKIISLLQIFKEGYISFYNVFYVMPDRIESTVIIDCKPYLRGISILYLLRKLWIYRISYV